MKKYWMIIVLASVSGMLNGQSLQEYFTIAAEQNPGLQAQYKEFEAALQKVAQVSSLPDPNLSLGVFLSPVETRVGPQWAKVSLSQMFPWFGTLKAQAAAATLQAEAKFQLFVNARNKLYYQVAAAYYPLCELLEFKRIEQENMALLTSYKQIATSTFKSGKGNMVDVLRVDMQLNEAKTRLAILDQKEPALKAQFNALLNRPDSADIALAPLAEMTLGDVAHRPDSTFAGHPLVKAEALKAEASKQQEAIALKQAMPKLGVGLDYVMVGQRNDVILSDNGKDVLMPMLTVSLPVFRAKHQAAVKKAQLMQEAFTLKQQEVSNTLSASYQMVWYKAQQQMAYIQLYNQQIKASSQSLDVLLKAYSNSGADFEEVLRMQQQLLSYQKLKTAATTALYTAMAELDYLTSKNPE